MKIPVLCKSRREYEFLKRALGFNSADWVYVTDENCLRGFSEGSPIILYYGWFEKNIDSRLLSRFTQIELSIKNP